MKLLLKLFFFISTCVLSISYAAADEGKLSVVDVWSRPTILLDRPGAAYFTIINNAAHADKLIKATTPLADRVELHVHQHEDGVMRMLEVDHIPVAANGKTEVKPGGYHLMLFGLTQKLGMGDSLPLILKLEQSGEIAVNATISKDALVKSGQ